MNKFIQCEAGGGGVFTCEIQAKNKTISGEEVGMFAVR